MNDSPYFLVIWNWNAHFRVVACAGGKKVGAYVYAGTLAIIVLWVLFEVGLDVSQLIPRIVVPSLIGAYIFRQVKTQPGIKRQPITLDAQLATSWVFKSES